MNFPVAELTCSANLLVIERQWYDTMLLISISDRKKKIYIFYLQTFNTGGQVGRVVMACDSSASLPVSTGAFSWVLPAGVRIPHLSISLVFCFCLFACILYLTERGGRSCHTKHMMVREGSPHEPFLVHQCVYLDSSFLLIDVQVRSVLTSTFKYKC